MLDLETVLFRVSRSCWEGSDYFFELPTSAYLSKAEAEADLADDEVVVTWAEMTRRVYRDIHQDA